MMFAAGLIVGLVVGIAIGVFLARKPSATAASAAPSAPQSAGDGTPLLDSILGGPSDGEPRTHASANDGEATVDQLRQNLRVKLLHDEAKVQQAIDAERNRDPGASEVELIRAAIQRWERDNH